MYEKKNCNQKRGNLCSANGKCVNTDGSFRCQCDDFFDQEFWSTVFILDRLIIFVEGVVVFLNAVFSQEDSVNKLITNVYY